MRLFIKNTRAISFVLIYYFIIKYVYLRRAQVYGGKVHRDVLRCCMYVVF